MVATMRLSKIQLVDKTFTESTTDTRIIKFKKFAQPPAAVFKDFVIDGLSVSSTISKAGDEAPGEWAVYDQGKRWFNQDKNEFIAEKSTIFKSLKKRFLKS